MLFSVVWFKMKETVKVASSTSWHNFIYHWLLRNDRKNLIPAILHLTQLLPSIYRMLYKSFILGSSQLTSRIWDPFSTAGGDSGFPHRKISYTFLCTIGYRCLLQRAGTITIVSDVTELPSETNMSQIDLITNGKSLFCVKLAIAIAPRSICIFISDPSRSTSGRVLRPSGLDVHPSCQIVSCT